MTGDQGPVAAHVFVSGRVQGVGYRAAAQQAARRLGLGGWVRNLPDGRVEAWIAGPRDHVERMIAWCRRGPERAWVRQVEVQWQEVDSPPRDFVIRR